MTVFQEAADPTTPASRLAELAFEHPEVRPIVALHPAAYDGLLDWLDEHGDANTRAAVAQRRGTAATPPPPPAAPAAGGYAAAVSAAPGSAPQPTPAAPRVKGPGLAISPRILFIGLGALLVLTLVVVAVIVVPRLVGGGGGGDVRVASYGSEPEEAWTLSGPEGFEGDFYDARARTVAQDRALISWFAEDDDDDDRLSLVDTRTGSILWDREADDGLGDASVVAVDSRAIVLNAYFFEPNEDNVLVSIDLGTGDILDELEDVTLLDTNTVLSDAIADRVYVQDGDEISVYSPSDLDNPRWTIDGDEDERVAVAGSRIINGSDVYSSDNGSALDWRADDEAYYFDYNGRLLESRTDDESFSALDPNTGKELWSVDYDSDYGLSFTRDALVLADDDTVTALDPSNGNELWEVDQETAQLYGSVALNDAGVIVLPTGDSEAVAYDVRSGELLYELDYDEYSEQVLGATQDTLYVASSRLEALDARTGKRRWSMSSFESYTFAGGNLIAYGDDEDELIVGYR